MSTFPPTKQLMWSDQPVFIHSCLEVTAWGNDMVKEYGPINEQGCDRCEGAPDGQWQEVRVKL